MSLFRLLVLGKRGVRTSSRKIRRLMKKPGLTEAWRLSEAELQAEWENELKAYKEDKRKQASMLRQRHLEVHSKSVKKAKSKATAARAKWSRTQRMLQKEETRRRRKAQGKGFSGGLQQIKVSRPLPDGGSQWATCSSKASVEAGCMRENQARYDQTRFPHPTPPMQDPLYSLFNGPEAEQNSRDLLSVAPSHWKLMTSSCRRS